MKISNFIAGGVILGIIIGIITGVISNRFMVSLAIGIGVGIIGGAGFYYARKKQIERERKHS